MQIALRFVRNCWLTRPIWKTWTHCEICILCDDQLKAVWLCARASSGNAKHPTVVVSVSFTATWNVVISIVLVSRILSTPHSRVFCRRTCEGHRGSKEGGRTVLGELRNSCHDASKRMCRKASTRSCHWNVSEPSTIYTLNRSWSLKKSNKMRSCPKCKTSDYNNRQFQ
jgi:hypothetical protein